MTVEPKDRYESAEEMVYALEPYWSKRLGNPQAIAAYMHGVFREEAREWRTRHRRTGITLDLPT